MEFEDSDPEVHFTQLSSKRKRTFLIFDVLYEDTMGPNEDIWRCKGSQRATKCNGFRSGFAAPVSDYDRNSGKDRRLCAKIKKKER